MKIDQKINTLHLVGNHLSFSSYVFALKRIDYLNNAEGFSADKLKFKVKGKWNLPNFIFRFFDFKNYLAKNFNSEIKLIHIYSIYDLILVSLFFWRSKRISICLSLYDLKMNKVLEMIIRPLMKRVDHFFVSSRFITDQLWSIFKVPPSRCTVLALAKYVDRKDIEFIKVDNSRNNEHDKKIFRIGCYLGSPKELGNFSRFKTLLSSHSKSESISFELILIKNEINKKFLPSNSELHNLKTVINHNFSHLNLDLWIIFSHLTPCPYINDALKQGAKIIAPSTNYVSELERVIPRKVKTYKVNEVSTMVNIVFDHLNDVISGSYYPYKMSQSPWIIEKEYLLFGYAKAVRRRNYLSIIK